MSTDFAPESLYMRPHPFFSLNREVKNNTERRSQIGGTLQTEEQIKQGTRNPRRSTN